MEKKHKSHFYILVAVVAAFAGILFGYDTGVISGAILFITNVFKLSDLMNGFVVSSVLIGAFIGALFSGRLSDYFGRKRLLIIDAIIFCIGTTFSAIAPDITLLVIGRIIVGIAIGIASYVAPVYISEISPPRYRGALVSLNQLAISIGILASYIVDYFLAEASNWRGMFLVGLVPAVALLIGMIFLPYSPRWILSRGKPNQSAAILRKIRGREDVDKELQDIRESLHHQRGSWKMLFSKKVRPVLTIGLGLAFLQQVTGINTILYYAPTIFKLSGFEYATSGILATMGIGVVFVLSTAIAMPFFDTIGRRPLLFAGLIGMAIGLIGLAGVFYNPEEMSSLHWLAIVSMLVYIASFGISLGPIMWLMISEIYPTRIRGLGSSVATCCNWASNWLVAFTFLTLVDTISATGTFMIYLGFCIIAFLFVYFKVPETKNVTLEHIEKNLLLGKHSRHLGR